jgi:hypothetical protein
MNFLTENVAFSADLSDTEFALGTIACPNTDMVTISLMNPSKMVSIQPMIVGEIVIGRSKVTNEYFQPSSSLNMVPHHHRIPLLDYTILNEDHILESTLDHLAERSLLFPIPDSKPKFKIDINDIVKILRGKSDSELIIYYIFALSQFIKYGSPVKNNQALYASLRRVMKQHKGSIDNLLVSLGTDLPSTIHHGDDRPHYFSTYVRNLNYFELISRLHHCFFEYGPNTNISNNILFAPLLALVILLQKFKEVEEDQVDIPYTVAQDVGIDLATMEEENETHYQETMAKSLELEEFDPEDILGDFIGESTWVMTGTSQQKESEGSDEDMY